VLLANGVSQALAMVGIALLTRYCFDAVQGRGPDAPETPALVGAAALASAGLGFLLLWLRTAEGAAAERFGQSYLTATRLLLFNHLNTVPSRVLQRRTRGVMMVRFVADLNALNGWVSQGVARLTVAAATAVVALVALAFLSPLIAVAVGVALSLAAAAVLATGKPLYQRVRALRRARGQLAANLGEKLTAYSPVQVFGRTSGERSRLERQSHSLADASVERAHLASFLRYMPDAIMPSITAAFLLLAMASGEAGQVTAGSFVAVILIVSLLASPLRDLTRTFVYWQDFRAARDVLSEFLALPSLVPAGPDLPRLGRGPGRLVFDEVSVAGSLRRVSGEVEPKSIVAIAGPSGAGKSTLLALAARLMDPDEGQVLIDGDPLAERELTSVRKVIGMMGPELPLLRGSVRRNLTYRDRKADDDEIAAILRLCDLEAAVAAMPRGLKTRIGEGGSDLAAGLRQQILLARAVMGRPRILLIDDADAILGERARESLDRVLGARLATTLIVTDNPRWTRLADAVWRLDGGRLDQVLKGDEYRAGTPVRSVRSS
jgi:ATP-binding cassette, subfamily B, bacterial